MGRLQLSACLSRNILTGPIISGQVVPEGIAWQVSALHPSEMFWRQLKFGDFDISEMSLASLCIAADRGVREWVALPIFTTRRFFHTGIVIREGAGIVDPGDMVSKRVGVPEYQQTAAVWARGALLHELSPRDRYVQALAPLLARLRLKHRPAETPRGWKKLLNPIGGMPWKRR